jgi:autotransporter-associated beta strand protein
MTRSARAATDTWNPPVTPLTPNWNDATNWGGAAPLAGDNLTFAGTNNLSTNNNFTAGTLFNSLVFDPTAGSFTLAGNALLLGGSSNGSIINNSSNLQTITLGLTLSNLSTSPPFGGNHFINGGTAGIALNPAGGLLRTLGSTADFAGTLSTTTITNDATGIIGGWATVGASTSASGVTFSSDLAAVVGGQIVAYTGYAPLTGAAAIASSPGTNYKWSTSTSPATLTAAGTTDINSLTFSDSTAATINMNLGQVLRVGVAGTIFRSSGASDTGLQIGNVQGQGTLTAGGPTLNTPGELILDANSATDPNPGITVDAVITDNGTGKVTLVKTGDGTAVLQPAAANSFTGDIYINQGKLRDQTAQAFGRGANIYVLSGGQAYFQTADVIPQNISISGIGVSEGGAFVGGAMRMAGNGVVLTGTITLTGDARITARGGTGIGGLITGQITGAHNIEIGGAATGVITLTNPSNNWTGNTTISSGTTRLGANEVIPSGAGKGDLIMNGDGNGGGATILDLFGATQTINGLTLGATTATATITNTSGIATFNVGANNSNSSYAGAFTTSATGSLNLNKIGSGTLTLSSTTAGNFTGTTTVVGGSSPSAPATPPTSPPAAALPAANSISPPSEPPVSLSPALKH